MLLFCIHRLLPRRRWKDVSLVGASHSNNLGFQPVFLCITQPDLPVVMPVDNAEMLRMSMQYNLVRLVTGNFYADEIHDQLNGDGVRVLDIISNSPW